MCIAALNAFCRGHRDEALVKARRARAYVSSTLTPKAVSELMLQRIRQHMRFPHPLPRMQDSEESTLERERVRERERTLERERERTLERESTLERAPRDTMHPAEARAKSNREL